jgi:hypothetical protein
MTERLSVATKIPAALEAVERDFSQRLAFAVAGARDPFDARASGVQWHLDERRRSTSCSASARTRGAWRSAGRPAATRSRRTASRCRPDGLRAAFDAGQLEDADRRALAHMILTLLREATTMIRPPPPTRAPNASEPVPPSP